MRAVKAQNFEVDLGRPCGLTTGQRPPGREVADLEMIKLVWGMTLDLTLGTITIVELNLL